MATITDHPTVAQLREIDLFEGLDDEQLGSWAQVAALDEASPDERIIEIGDQAKLVLLIAGRLEMLTPEGEVEAVWGAQIAPTWIGAIPSMLGVTSMVTMRAVTDVTYAVLSADDFVDLLLVHKDVFRRAMKQVKPVMGRMLQRQESQDRLEALGTMAAGLAHELNNPAAAARRTAGELADSLEVLSRAIGVFVESGVERDEAARLVALQAEAQERCAAQDGDELSGLELADREDAIGDALEAVGVPEAWTLNGSLAAAGIEPEFVHRVADEAGELAAPVLRWITASLSARQLAGELSQSTEQMSQLVRAIKKYAYMDRGEIVEVDLREGLDTTLTILKHKLKHTSIEVVRNYDESLGPVTVHGAELNQVWTNLLDNAIDALGDAGTITITTRADGDCVEVDIADDGPGIPEDVRRRVFDPFFTTKDVGKGTGLGLDAARRIVVDRHRGSLTVESRTNPPTGSMFRVRIPAVARR